MGSNCENHEVSFAKNTRNSICHLRGTGHFTCWDSILSKVKKLLALSDYSFNPTYLCSGHFLIDEPLIQYLLLTLLTSNALEFPGGNSINNKLNSSCIVGHPTTTRICNSVNAFRGDPLTYIQSISSCWERKTRHHFTRPQLLSRKPIQWGWHFRVVTLRNNKGVIKRPITKFCHLPLLNSDL